MLKPILAIFSAAVLSLQFAGNAQAQTSYSYSSLTAVPNVSWSSNPLTAASDGNVYWPETDANGGAIYQITPSGTVTAIYSFNCDNGPCDPFGPVIQGTDGFLYGTTYSGGTKTQGSFFKVALDGSGFTDLYDFDGVTDGGSPVGGLTLGDDGNFYGVGNSISGALVASAREPLGLKASAKDRFPNRSAATSTRARTRSQSDNVPVQLSLCSNPSATFFQLTPDGQMTALYCSTDTNLPNSPYPLVEANDGNFYGISTGPQGASPVGPVGAPGTAGQIFQLTPAGGYAVMSQSIASGLSPNSGLAGGPDGTFYATINGTNCGSVYQWDPSNSYSQTDFADLDCTDGYYPDAVNLYLASDGAFYSSATFDSTNGTGSVFRMDMSGNVTYPYDFVSGSGMNPYTSPVQNGAGNFVGTTGDGSSNYDGTATIYSLVPSSALKSPVTLAVQQNGSAGPALVWSVNNASPLTPPNCVALVNNGPGLAGWSGILSGSFIGKGYYGSTSITPPAGQTTDFEIVCPGQGSASASFAAPAQSSVTLSTGTPEPVAGGKLTITATVKGSSPTGTVSFKAGSMSATAPVVSGVATITVNTAGIAAGKYSVKASYSGDARNSASANSLSVNLQKAPTLTLLSVQYPSVVKGQLDTLTATVYSSTTTPTGTVQFSDGKDVLCTVSLKGTTAICTVTAPQTGSFAITADYMGDSEDSSSVSKPVTVTARP